MYGSDEFIIRINGINSISKRNMVVEKHSKWRKKDYHGELEVKKKQMAEN